MIKVHMGLEGVFQLQVLLGYEFADDAILSIVAHAGINDSGFT